MLTEKQVRHMAELFFNGQPEEAYCLVSDSNEWDQFINSIKKKENRFLAYKIMGNSDLRIWDKHAVIVPFIDYPLYDIGY